MPVRAAGDQARRRGIERLARSLLPSDATVKEGILPKPKSGKRRRIWNPRKMPSSTFPRTA
jgi:hypothetical protein